MNPTDPHPVSTPSPTAPASALKPGWLTTEFYMTLLSNLGLLLAAANGAIPPKYAALAAAASQVAYNLSRGLAKQPQPPSSVAAASPAQG